MSLEPPKIKTDDKLQDFIGEPEQKNRSVAQEASVSIEPDQAATAPQRNVKKIQFPWEAPGVTPEIIKPFSLRIPQPDKLKVKYIVENSLEYRSIQDFFMKAILKQVEKDLKRFEK